MTLPGHPFPNRTRLLENIPKPGLALCMALALAIPACLGWDPPLTFVYVPADSDLGLVLDLGVNISVLYAPPRTWNETRRQVSLSLCRNLSESGSLVYLVVGHNMDSPDPADTYDEINASIADFLPYLTGIIIGDDVMSKGNITTLNAVGPWVAGNWSGRLDIGLGLDPPNETGALDALDLDPYRFICTYCYSQIDIQYHYIRFDPDDELPSMVAGQGSDPGETGKLAEWVSEISEYAGEEGKDVWFMLAAFSEGDFLSTPSQMYLDLDIVRDAGFEAIGWFAASRVGDRDSIVFVGGENAGPYDWLAYYFMKTVLVGRAREPTSQQLLEAIGSLFKDLNNMTEDLNWTANLTRDLSSSFNDLHQNVNQIEEWRRQAEEDLGSLESMEGMIASLDEDVDRLESGLSGDLARLQGQLGNAARQINNLTNKVRATNEDVASWATKLNESLSILNDTTLLLGEKQNNIISNLSELKENLSATDEQLKEDFGNLGEYLQIGLGLVIGNISEAGSSIDSLGRSVGGLTEEVSLLKLDRDRALSDLQSLEQRVDDLTHARQRDRMQVLLAVLTMGVVLAMVDVYLVVRFHRIR